jgi:type IV pilus assembly protein PilV
MVLSRIHCKTNIMGPQAGVVLLEALIGILFFSLGILGLIGLQAMSIRHTADAKIRADATYLANQIIGQMWLDRANIATYAHNPTGPICNPDDVPSTNANVQAWLGNVTSASSAAALPGATEAMQQIILNTAANNAVTVRLCWRLPADEESHNLVVTANIN